VRIWLHLPSTIRNLWRVQECDPRCVSSLPCSTIDAYLVNCPVPLRIQRLGMLTARKTRRPSWRAPACSFPDCISGSARDGRGRTNFRPGMDAQQQDGEEGYLTHNYDGLEKIWPLIGPRRRTGIGAAAFMRAVGSVSTNRSPARSSRRRPGCRSGISCSRGPTRSGSPGSSSSRNRRTPSSSPAGPGPGRRRRRRRWWR
jgi:hypothetical protein